MQTEYKNYIRDRVSSVSLKATPLCKQYLPIFSKTQTPPLQNLFRGAKKNKPKHDKEVLPSSFPAHD